MRFSLLFRPLLVAFVAALCISVSGCEQKQEAAGPEMGSIEAYLVEHPEEAVDDPDEAGDEAEEFDAGS